MSYTPTTWAAGDTVTATKLNNMETGIDNAANPFIVTLTPTALDYSGTMDKTVAEIYAAYQAGKRIYFGVSAGTDTAYVPVVFGFRNGVAYPSFNAYIIMDTLDVLIFAATTTTNDGTKDTYSTTIYSLTPAT